MDIVKFYGILYQLERLVARQLVDYLSERKLLPELQSAYRAYHSRKTAVLRVLSDIFEALDRGDWAALTLLDLSAAFDTVDHTTLIRRLHISYGFNDVVLGWFLQRVCIACYAERCISYDRFCLTDRLTV